MCIEVSFGRIEDGKSTIIEDKVVKTIFVIGEGHEQRSLHTMNIPDASEQTEMTQVVASRRAQVGVRNQLGNYKTRQNNFNIKGRKRAAKSQSGLTTKAPGRTTRSIWSNRKLRRPVLSEATRTSRSASKKQSQGMHTQEVPEPYQWLVRWVCCGICLSGGGGRWQVPTFCSPTTARERSVYQKIWGAMSAIIGLCDVCDETLG